MGLSDFIIESGVLKKYIGKGGVVEIPSCVTIIADRVFANNIYITKVIIPESVKHIGKEAFTWCRYITNVKIYGKNKTMGDSVFSGCTNLTDVSLSCDVGQFAFDGCENLKNVDLYGATVIGASAFRACKKLTEIYLPNTLTTIRDGAFTDCIRLGCLRIPGSVKTLGYFSFVNCFNLENIYFDTCFKDRIIAVEELKWGDASGYFRTYHFKDGRYEVSRSGRKFYSN